MKQQKQNIKQFKLHSSAKAGFFIGNIQNKTLQKHDVSVPHRDDHFLLMFAFSGEFHFKVDFEDLMLKSPFILSIEPNQIHQMLIAKDGEGWMLEIDEFILEPEFKSFLSTKLSQPILLKDNKLLIDNINTILRLAFELQNNASDVYTHKSILFLINSLFCLLFSQSENSTKKVGSKEKRSYIIAQSFRQLLKKEYKNWKSPSQYASALNITVSHLNDTVKEITGLPVSQHIQQQNILEAKRLLYFTDYEVQEIAFQLGYDNAVYFGKLFKKITCRSPLEFRKKFRD